MLIYLQMIEDDSDKGKFERLYNTYKQTMYQVAFDILHNNDDAEDAVHDAFVSIAKNIKKISDVDCLKTYSYVVIISERKAIDIYRKNQKITDVDYGGSGGGVVINIPVEQPLYVAMAKLPANYREILLLRFANGYTQKELSKILDMSPANVQQTLYRAKKALQKRLDEENDS